MGYCRVGQIQKSVYAIATPVKWLIRCNWFVLSCMKRAFDGLYCLDCDYIFAANFAFSFLIFFPVFVYKKLTSLWWAWIDSALHTQAKCVSYLLFNCKFSKDFCENHFILSWKLLVMWHIKTRSTATVHTSAKAHVLPVPPSDDSV